MKQVEIEELDDPHVKRAKEYWNRIAHYSNLKDITALSELGIEITDDDILVMMDKYELVTLVNRKIRTVGK